MISGGGSAGSMGGAAGGGLGFFIWNSYVGGSYTQIVVGMISIGIAGYMSSAVLRKIGIWMTPWLSAMRMASAMNIQQMPKPCRGRSRRCRTAGAKWPDQVAEVSKTYGGGEFAKTVVKTAASPSSAAS